MLKLDEKKIRKGRPIGLPYQESKKKISKKIVEIIKQNFGTDKPIYDIFGGGGAITAECILNGLEVHYNDLDKDITNAFERVISQDREWIKTLIVSRTEFTEIKDKENKTTDDFLKLYILLIKHVELYKVDKVTKRKMKSCSWLKTVNV